MWNDGLNEAQAGVKIAGRNINNLRYADDTILLAESKEELKSLLMKVKEESENFGLKLNIQRLSLIHFIFLPPLSKIRCSYVRGFISGLSILFHWSILTSGAGKSGQPLVKEWN